MCGLDFIIPAGIHPKTLESDLSGYVLLQGLGFEVGTGNIARSGASDDMLLNEVCSVCVLLPQMVFIF